MTLLEQWRGSAYNENMTQEQYNQFWNHYFVIEKGFYESLLADNEVVTGTIPQLAEKYGMLQEFELFERVERLAPGVFADVKGDTKVISANVDFYSGFVYSMLDLPMELYTPMFAIARIAGWSAHRIEELVNPGKIIRPAYKSIAPHKEYVPLDSRD